MDVTLLQSTQKPTTHSEQSTPTTSTETAVDGVHGRSLLTNIRTNVNLSTMSAADPVAQSTPVANVANVGYVGSPHIPTCAQGSMPFIPNAAYTFPGLPPPVPSMPSVTSYSISLTDEDVERIALKVQNIISHEIETLVTLKIEARMEC